jgi:hypothetical protein
MARFASSNSSISSAAMSAGVRSFSFRIEG